MEADWSVEIGADLPRIEVPWADAASGLHFVDLRTDPEALDALIESMASPALREAMRRCNAPYSPVFTSKCDIWELGAEDIDPLDFGLRPSADPLTGMGSYLDVLLRDATAFAGFATQEAWLRALCARLSEQACEGVRVEFVLRLARQEALDGYAVTTYVLAAAESTATTRHRLSAAWEQVSLAVLEAGTP